MLRRLLNPIVILGAAIVGLCWTAVAYQLHSDYTETISLAVERGDSMARLFEKDTIRLLKGIDTTLLLLRQAYENNAEKFDLVKTARQSGLVGDVATEFGQITANGYLVQTTSGQLEAPIYVGDRKHFIAQRNNPEDELFIGDPVFLRSTGKYSIPVARRLRAPDGTFAGILTGQVDPLFVEQFSQTLKLGPGSNISIRGLDGVLRASYGFVTPPVQQTAVMKEAMTHAHDGYFWGGGAADGVTRLVTYRSLSDFPLVLTIGESEEHIFAGFRHHRLIYVSVAAAFTLVTIIFVVMILQRQSTLERSNSRLETVNRRFDTALSHITQGITMYDRDHKLVVRNDRFAKIYGFSPELVTVGRPFRELIAYQMKVGNVRQDPDRYVAIRMERLSRDRIYSAQHLLANGRTVAVFSHALENGGWVSTHEDITDRKNSETRIEQLAHFDTLTGLANRNLFKERVEETLAHYRRQGEEFAVVLLDLDKFKGVNDTLGHQCGDVLLREVASRIKATVRDVDLAARLGGDEFAVLVQPGKGETCERSEVLAARLVDAVSAPYAIDGHPVVVGCSIGIALIPLHGERIDEVLRNADLALYKSKSAGRNCFHVYSNKMKTEADQRSALEIDLREAIWGDQLEVHYQPVIELDTGRVVSVEALARWHHKTKGLIPPSEFISVAEEAGLIVELGNWVMLKACHDVMQMPKDIKVAVNLSPVQFAKSNVVEAAMFATAESGLAKERLELEITEGVLLEESEQNLATLRQLKEVGVSIALDDFGVGFSSLAYLTVFPFDKVKIDKSFIDRLDRPETSAVIASIVQLTTSLNRSTVAEGIETQDQFDRVRSLGVKFGQGYMFSKPVPASELKFEPLNKGHKDKVA
jgi:diguanylate cyclase (GGDEF)-like protein/PAS domain S-box-containing protein